MNLLKALLISLIGVLLASVAVAQEDARSTPPELIDPAIPSEELAYELIPLTKEQLEPLARAWQGIVQRETEVLSDKKINLLRKPEAATDAAYQEIAQMTEARAGTLERYVMVLNALESKGGDPDLVSDLRTYRESVLFNETILATPRAVFFAFLNWLTRVDGGLAIAMDIGIVALSFLALLIVARAVRGLARKWIGRVPNISNLLEVFLTGVVFWLVIVFGLLIVLASLGVNITPLFAMIGGASFILAFAFQDTLGNLASGLMIMINQPFDEGDYVEVGGVGGAVKSVSIVATTVTTGDNQVIVIPNKNVWGNVITNVTASDTRRVDLVFGISYEDSIPEAMDVLRRVVINHPAVLKDPQPNIRVHQLADSSVNFICRPWSRTEDYWTVYWDLTHQVKEAFDAAGVSIPYPQQDVHFKTKEA
ncbi:mechanosensitive ion channel family protein [Aestuariivita boseongensis]|uniref:mechanosensitive ion channel family protein n=1 Tax=Aestuariivita boseongensis TaxID=1470562 RepID=UPI00068070AF|nr:mechanosensitive ion channel domain-containing protein [Aestuariivita boseongensis]